MVFAKGLSSLSSRSEAKKSRAALSSVSYPVIVGSCSSLPSTPPLPSACTAAGPAGSRNIIVISTPAPIKLSMYDSRSRGDTSDTCGATSGATSGIILGPHSPSYADLCSGNPV